MVCEWLHGERRGSFKGPATLWSERNRPWWNPEPAPPPKIFWYLAYPAKLLRRLLWSLQPAGKKISPFLQLPREIRDIIYWHAAHQHEPLGYREPILGTAPEDSGILYWEGFPPARNLLQVNRQIYQEVMSNYFSTTTFHLPPLAPHDVAWRIDPLYKKLSQSGFLRCVTKLSVTIELTDLRASSGNGNLRYNDWEYRWVNPGLVWKEMSLQDCVALVTAHAELLVKVLLTAKALKRLVVEWVDDFPHGDENLKGMVLKCFEPLGGRGVNVELGKLVVAAERRAVMKKFLGKHIDTHLEGRT